MDTSLHIEKTKQAIDQTHHPEDRLTLRMYLLDLYREAGQKDQALSTLKDLISEFESRPVNDTNTLAGLYNNLGLLLAGRDLKAAIGAFRQADRMYRENEAQNTLRLAGVNYQLSQLYTRLKDNYYIKKYLKETLVLFERSKSQEVFEAQARAYQQLAQIYSDQLLLFDARNNFKKALDVYEKMDSENNRDLALLKGGIMNNLGVTYQQMESFNNAEAWFLRALTHYEDLESKSHGFLPWVGATLTNLANLYAEYERREQALKYAQKAHTVYQHLSKEHPEYYMHYLATSEHNLGLLHMNGDTEMAEHYFKEAIRIRKVLAAKHPESFNADLAVSLMNLVELYHEQWELTLNHTLKEKALALLKTVENRAGYLPGEHPAVNNVLNDLDYYLQRFKNEDLSGLHFLKITRELLPLKEEVNSTIIPGEKIPAQSKIVRLLRNHVQQYPGHYHGLEVFSDALSELAWYYMRLGGMKKALVLLREMRHLRSDLSAEAKCNLAHGYLLSGDDLKAIEFYTQVLPLKNEDKKPIRETLMKDLHTLKSDGVLEKVPKSLETLLDDYS